jgi:phospholipid transport system substrate-binding protein
MEQTARRRWFRVLVAAGMALALFVAPSGRGLAVENDPQAVVGYVGAQGMATMGSNVSAAQRIAILRELFAQYFDIGHIAAFALGNYRRSATEQQLQEYERLYQEYTVETYSAQLSQIGAAPFQVTGARPYGEQVAVSSEIGRSGGSPIKIDWYLVKRHGKYKISDLSIGSTSMRATQRNEFARWIESNGGRFDALLAVMRQQITQFR